MSHRTDRKKSISASLAAAVLPLCVSGLGAQTIAEESDKVGLSTRTQLQALLDEMAKSTGTAGAQISVIIDNRRSDFVYGTANAELNTPMTVDTVVQLGSATKLFNAAIVMSLVDEGKLALDAPVTRYIPDLKLGGSAAPDAITLRRLLSMSAGLDFGPTEGGKGDDALGKYVADLGALPLAYTPGQGFGYSNASVCIAAHAAERVTGQTWDALLKNRVFKPASLTQAANKTTDLPFVRVAVGHTTTNTGQPLQVLRPWDDQDATNPSGSGQTIAMSAHDLASFGNLFINGGKAENGERVLSQEAVKAMMTPTTFLPMAALQWGMGDQWGLGPTRSDWGKAIGWGHGGSARGGSSLLLWFPDRRAVLAFTVNSPTAIEPFTVRFTSDFTGTVLDVRAPTRAAAPAKSIRVRQPQRLVGTYIRSGDRVEISERNGKLRYREFNEALIERLKQMNQPLPPGKSVDDPLVDEDLVPLGEDRFLVNFPGFAHGIQVFFFGKDELGRATNLNSGLRTSRRVSATR